MHTLRAFLGIETGPSSHREKLLSALGGFAAIFGILFVSQLFVDSFGAQLIIASMGASAVLLFAVPHGPLSQPWSLIGGHLVSALIGVTCARYIPHAALAAGMAVGLAIGAMYYLRCIHPPGGATALVAVVGGPAVHGLGYQFVLTPVLLNVAIIFSIALLFNYPFAWRRYPAYLTRHSKTLTPAKETEQHIEHADFVYALSQLDSFVDVSEQDLLRIYTLATGRARSRHLLPQDIKAGHFYCNGESGADWAVRQVVDESRNDSPEKDAVIYKVVAGAGARRSGMSTRLEFGRWAAFEVAQVGEEWRRVAPSEEL